MCTEIFELTFQTPLPVHGIGERPIDPSLLTEIAPDREELIENTPIDQLREFLRASNWKLSDGRWLLNQTEQTRVRIRNTPRRLRSWVQMSFKVAQHAVSSLAGPVAGPPGESADGAHSIENLRLSTLDVTVSPRPLGPTHSLVMYEERPTPNGVFPRIVEMPITGLIFAAHCPNFKAKDTNRARFPYRLPNSLPKVVVRVPHLDTFPALVVYMHNHNQAELFRTLTPQCIRDIIHPLPLVGGLTTTGFDDVSRDIAKSCSYEQIVLAASKVDGLRRNIRFVGLQILKLDAEVDLYLRIMIKAINYKAFVDDSETDSIFSRSSNSSFIIDSSRLIITVL